jgi:hypothetical protein
MKPLPNNKKARQAEALKKAKRKKAAAVSACILAAVVVAALFIANPGPAVSGTAPDGVIDLTRMSATMAYATIGNIYEAPRAHLGTMIRARGIYHPYSDDFTGINYHFITLTGAPGCCPQILEFKLNGDAVYPLANSTIEITGRLSSYEESGNAFFYWAVDDMEVLN